MKKRKKATTAGRKSSTKKQSMTMHQKLNKLGLRMPHGYELVKKKRK